MFWITITLCFICQVILVDSQDGENVTCVTPHFDRFMVKTKNQNENYAVGTRVEIICRPGFYNLQANVYVECLSDGMWTTPNAECHRKQCSNPGDILNGEVIITDPDNAFKFGTNITYKCNTGYLLLGATVRTCLLKYDSNSVDWQPAAPICEIEKCKIQPNIENGKYYPVQEFYRYLETVTFTCDDKEFSLIGNRTTTCLTNGTWSSPFPKCERITCKAPNINHGTLIVGSSSVYKHGQSVTVGCDDGFTLHGSKMSTCEYSSWNPPLPTCEPINKPDTTPSNPSTNPGTTKHKTTTTEIPKPNTPTPTTPNPKTPTTPNPKHQKTEPPKQTKPTPSETPQQNPPISPPSSKWKRHVVLVLFASVASVLFVLVSVYCCFLK
ncbi:ORF4 [macacine gammaherpesvirus 12]|nr:ORF4 [Macaca nemestrina rhadinovirus 2]AJE29643.1 ORF4 [Macaca nemestrina rhadinovirus 2]